MELSLLPLPPASRSRLAASAVYELSGGVGRVWVGEKVAASYSALNL